MNKFVSSLLGAFTGTWIAFFVIGIFIFFSGIAMISSLASSTISPIATMLFYALICRGQSQTNLITNHCKNWSITTATPATSMKFLGQLTTQAPTATLKEST